MSRGKAADNSFTPVELERLFQTAARIDGSDLRDDLQNVSITLSFLVYFLGYLGFRLGFALHFSEEDVIRNSDGEIIAINVPYYKECTRDPEKEVCSHCRTLAKARARYAEDDNAVAEDFYDEYWSPKSYAGGRTVPVLQPRGREIIELFLETEGELNMVDESVRRRLTRLAELTEDIDPDRMMPQSLRASAANYWIMREKFDTHGLKMLMGWKYLSTAEYYVSSGFAQLWHKMSRALGMETDGPFNVKSDPESYSEIRNNRDLIHVHKITPQSEVARHKYSHLPNPLEEEARSGQKQIGDYTDDSEEVGITSDPISAWTRARIRVEHAAAAGSDKLDAYPPSPKRAVAIIGGLFCWATFVGTIWGLKGALYYDPIAGTYGVTLATIVGLVIGTLLVMADLPELEDPDNRPEPF